MATNKYTVSYPIDVWQTIISGLDALEAEATSQKELFEVQQAKRLTLEQLAKQGVEFQEN